MTGDPATHRIFAVRTSVAFTPPDNVSITNEILTIDSETGTYSVSPPVDAPIGNIAFDPATNTVYVIGVNGLFRVDPTTGATTLTATLANVGGSILSMAVVPGAHTIYVNDEEQRLDGSFMDQILVVDTQTGTISTSPALAQPVRIIGYDPSLGNLFGATECCPRNLVRIDPISGAETSVGTITDDPTKLFAFAMAIDPGSHTAFMDVSTWFPDTLTTEDEIVSMNEQTGAETLSPVINDMVWSQYFEPVVASTSGTP
jgi:hypothetical protein